MKKMEVRNIAIIISSLSGGGAEKVAAMLSEYLSEREFNVIFFLDSYDKKTAYRHRGKIVRLLNVKTKNKWLDLYYKAKDLKKKKRLCEIDCAISFMEDSNFINVFSRTEERVVVSVRTFLSGRMEEWRKDAFRFRILIPLLYNKADRVVTLTGVGKKDLHRNFGVKNHRIEVIPNPVDTTEADQEICVEMGDHAIVMVGRLEAVKAHWHAIMAMKHIVTIDNRMHLYIIGKGYLIGELKDLVNEYGLESNVHFMGFQKDVKSFLRRAKMFVLTSTAEGFPNSLLDALASGIPVISTDCISGPRDILAPGTSGEQCKTNIEFAEYGILIPCLTECEFEKTQVLAEAVLKLDQDKKIWTHYAQKAKERAGAYEKETIFEQWEQLIMGT